MTKKMEEICNLLSKEKIDFQIREHKAVFSIEELPELKLPGSELIAKNLFIRDEKKLNYYLLVVQQDKKVELKSMREKINSKRLSFASEQDLNLILGVSAGSVSPLGILNDQENKVQVFIDEEFRQGKIGIHPNDNTATIWMNTLDLAGFARKQGNPVAFVTI